MSVPSTDDRKSRREPAASWHRFLPLCFLLLVSGVVWVLGIHHLIGLETLIEIRVVLAELVIRHPMAMAAGFVTAYVLVVALSLPGAAFMTLAGGLLFGTMLGGMLAILGATLGACVLFLAARAALAGELERRAGARLRGFVTALRRQGFLYLLTLRLLPVAPFWVVNFAGALAGMGFAPFALATALGVIPGTFMFASVGAGLSLTLDAGRRPELSTILTLPLLVPLAVLAVLSLAGAWWRSRCGQTQQEPPCPTPTSP